MRAQNRNQLWADVLVGALVEAGVRELCLAPGSRSTALVFAAEAASELRVRVFLDERSAAFFALGIGKATGVPAAVLTTSGTAVANLLPAVVEAAQSETPLILLTADRPPRLRDADANQAIHQPGIFGSYPREAWDLPVPVMELPALRHLRAVGARAVASAIGLPGGPVHINAPFEKPLEPTAVDGDIPEPVLAALRSPNWTERRLRIHPRRPAASESDREAIVDLLEAAERPIVVVGAVGVPFDPRPVLAFAGQAGAPVLADPLARTRFGASRGVTRTAHHDLFLRSAAVRRALEPDLILRVGQAPTSSALLGFLEECTVPQVVVDGGERWKDHANTATRVIHSEPSVFFERLADETPRAAADWRTLWERIDEVAGRAIDAAPGPRHEGHLAALLAAALPEGTPLFVSSSMPIRDLDAYPANREAEVPVFGNRGASGIDGIVSTAMGVAAGTGRRTVALVGDLAFLHDSNGLLAAREEDADVLFVVVNNDGGGIFHMLPVEAHDPPFTRLFATPHGVDLSRISAAWGVPHRTAALDEADEALRDELSMGGCRVLEIRTDREANRVGHAATAAAVVRAAEGLLNGD